MRFDFAMTGEGGRELEPLFGPGLTGLRNLGNRSVFHKCGGALANTLIQLLLGIRPANALPDSGI